MNFEFSEDQLLLREMIKDFARSEISPHVRTLEDRHEFPREILLKLGKLGVLGMSVPVEYGGSKTDNVSLAIAIEELSRVFPSLAVIISVHCSLFCYAINRFGTEAQKAEYLPRAASGQVIGAFSLTEPGAGSDATSLRAKSVKQGDCYILNGIKSWVTTGYDSGALILMTASEASTEKRRMLNAFILDKDTPGISVSKIEEKMGLHASPTAEIVLDNCRVPVANLLGGENKGATVAFQCLDSSRIGIAAQAVGVAQRALDEAVRYAQQREAFGRKIHDFQAIQFMIADMSSQLEAARLLTYRAASLSDLGKPFGKESAMAKLYASEAANRIASLSLQIHGGYGYSKEFFIEQLYRDARVLAIYEGTSEVQRLVIARHLLRQD